MRFPRPRLRLRTLLIVVVISGTALGGWTMWRRHRQCLERVAQLSLERSEAEKSLHDDEWVLESFRLMDVDLKKSVEESAESDPESASRVTQAREKAHRLSSGVEQETGHLRKRLDQLDRRIQSYRHVARYPWLPLPMETD